MYLFYYYTIPDVITNLPCGYFSYVADSLDVHAFNSLFFFVFREREIIKICKIINCFCYWAAPRKSKENLSQQLCLPYTSNAVGHSVLKTSGDEKCAD